MAWGAILGAGASLLGGLFGSRSQDRATQAQLQSNQQSLESQERLAREAMAQQGRFRQEDLAYLYPRQRAGNAALQQLTDLYGLGDNYAPPTEGSLGGGAAFYPGAPVQAGQGNGIVGINDWGGSPESYQAYLRSLATNPNGQWPGMFGNATPPGIY